MFTHSTLMFSLHDDPKEDFKYRIYFTLKGRSNTLDKIRNLESQHSATALCGKNKDHIYICFDELPHKDLYKKETDLKINISFKFAGVYISKKDSHRHLHFKIIHLSKNGEITEGYNEHYRDVRKKYIYNKR